ncbi:hypothetical protein ACHAPT_013358 [Fusarium lateritium]
MARDDRDVEKTVDKALLACGSVVSCVPLGLSAYCDTYKIGVQVPEGSIQSFFAKVSRGQAGFDLLLGTNFSESSLHSFIPEHVPRPVGFGTYESDSNRHFFLTEWVDMRDKDEPPRPEAYMAPVVALHSRSMGMSPTGKFGFGVKMAFGNLPQVNKWEDSWEAWWTNYMTMILDREESLRGPHTLEDKQLKDQFINKVLRYLRLLESNGRSIKPCFLHADLWPGNIKYQLENETAVIYDSSGLWGHNEVDLGVIRNPRYPLGSPYLEEYWKHTPISEPREDADSRNIMYLVRNQVLLASLYPEDHSLRNSFVQTMRVVVDRVLEEEARAGSGIGLVTGRPRDSTFAELEKNGVSQPRVAQLATGVMVSTD